MTSPATIELDQETRLLALRYLELHERVAQLNAEAEAIKAVLRQRYTIGQSGAIDGQPVFTVQANRRFDVDKAKTLLPPELIPACETTTLDPKKVRQYLAPALVETCMVANGQPKIVLA